MTPTSFSSSSQGCSVSNLNNQANTRPKIPVSVFVIAVDEGDRIARTIESVRDWADEVIVIDSGSKDDTVQVSTSAGARVIYNAWPGYGEQKRFGEDQCRNDWLLNIDADEVISAALANEICALFATGLPVDSGYTMDIVEILPWETMPGWFAHKVNAIRLYDRRCGRFDASTEHDSVHMHKGSVGMLHHIVEHRSSRGFTHSIAKINRYSTMQADNMLARNARPILLGLRIVLEFPIGFFKAYILRGYFLKGFYGFINSVNYGFSRFARLIKYWEAEREKNLPR